jgi:hypothetical protein
MQFGNSVTDIVVWNVYKNNSFYANINQANLPTPNYSLSFGNITCPVLLEPNKPIFVTMDWQNPLNNTMTMQYRANTKLEIVEQ